MGWRRHPLCVSVRSGVGESLLRHTPCVRTFRTTLCTVRFTLIERFGSRRIPQVPSEGRLRRNLTPNGNWSFSPLLLLCRTSPHTFVLPSTYLGRPVTSSFAVDVFHDDPYRLPDPGPLGVLGRHGPTPVTQIDPSTHVSYSRVYKPLVLK